LEWDVPRVYLTRYRGIKLGQPHSEAAGLLLSHVKGGLRDPKASLQLAILPSRLGTAILTHPPLMKVAPGIVAIIGIRGIRRRGRHRRCGVRRPTGPRKRTKAVVHDEPRNKVEEFIAVNRMFADRRHEQKPSISPHASETLVHRHILLRDFLRCALASVVFAGHEG